MTIRELEANETYTSVNLFDQSNSNFLIDNYGWQKTSPNASSHGVGVFALHFVVRGSITISYNGKKHVANRNSCFLLKPDKSMEYISNSQTPAQYYWCNVSGSAAWDFFKRIGFSNDKLVIDIPNFYAKKVRDAFFKALCTPKEFHNIRHLYMYESLYRLSRNIYLSQLTTDSFLSIPPTTSQAMVNVINYIEKHYTESNLTLQTIAQEFFFHPNYLSGLFKNELGMNFKTYLTQKRIHYAGVLIRQGEKNIGILAYKVGIPDESYFIKVFKKINSITPHQEIIQQKNKNATPPPKDKH